jgi:hypothetical protein
LKRNGRATRWTLAPEDATKALKEEEKENFLKVGKVKEGDARYSLDWIEDQNQVLRFAVCA